MSGVRTKIKSPSALARELSALRRTQKGKATRVVFTNGCFDLLHAGHVTYLEKARKQGDLLIVALNTDESVRRLKGPQRPMNPLADRLLVMASLGFVDRVTWFSEDTPLELIQKLTPQVLIKGADYSVSQIVGADWVIQNGGKVKTVALVPGKSTTALIEKAIKPKP